MKVYNTFWNDPPVLDPPLLDETPGGLQDPNDPEYNPNHDLYWAYGKDAGGWVIPWPNSMFKGRRLNSLPYRYLSWCYFHLKHARKFPEAFEEYNAGLLDRVDEDYREFRVTCGKKHRGQRLKECRDKPWLIWLIAWAKKRKDFWMLHEAFLMAAEKFLENPDHQEVHRDLGEKLSSTKYEDDIVNAEMEYDGLLGRKPYAGKVKDEDEDMNEDEDGFIVPDNYVEYDEGDSNSGLLVPDDDVGDDEQGDSDSPEPPDADSSRSYTKRKLFPGKKRSWKNSPSSSRAYDDLDDFIVPDDYVEYEDSVDEQRGDTDSLGSHNSGAAKSYSKRRRSSRIKHENSMDGFIVPDDYVEYEGDVEHKSETSSSETAYNKAANAHKSKPCSNKRRTPKKSSSSRKHDDGLDGFIVPDDYVEYEGDVEHQSETSSSEAANHKTPNTRKNKLSSNKRRTPKKTSSSRKYDDGLDGFIVPDDYVEYEGYVEQENESSSTEASDHKLAKAYSKSRRPHKKRTAHTSSRTREKDMDEFIVPDDYVEYEDESKTRHHNSAKSYNIKRQCSHKKLDSKAKTHHVHRIKKPNCDDDDDDYVPDRADELIETRDEALAKKIPTLSDGELEDIVPQPPEHNTLAVPSRILSPMSDENNDNDILSTHSAKHSPVTSSAHISGGASAKKRRAEDMFKDESAYEKRGLDGGPLRRLRRHLSRNVHSSH